MNGLLCEGLYLRWEGRGGRTLNRKAGWCLCSGKGAVVWAHMGLQGHWALPGTCEACAWALLFLASETSGVVQQLGAQVRPLLPPTCPLSSISCTHHHVSPFPQQAWSFLLPGLCTGCSLNRNAHPSPGSCKTQFSSVFFLSGSPQATVSRVSRSLLRATCPLGILFMQSSTYHWAGINFPVCSPTPQLTN